MIFLKQPAEDPTVDADLELRRDDYTWTRISIQDARSYAGVYIVNRYGPENDFWMKSIGETRSLKQAKALALSAAQFHAD